MKKEKFESHYGLRVSFLEGTKLRILYDDEVAKVHDAKEWIKFNPIFKKLLNRSFFIKGRIEYGDAVIWSDEIDIDLDALYDSGNKVSLVDEDIPFIVGYKIKKARLKKGLSQIELAKISKIDQGDISKIENGHWNISIVSLSKIANALDLNLEINLVKKQ